MYAKLEAPTAQALPPHEKLRVASRLRVLYLSGWAAALIVPAVVALILASLEHTDADTAWRRERLSKVCLALNAVSFFGFGGMMTFAPKKVAALQQGPNLYPGIEPTGPIVVKFITYTGSYVLLIGAITVYCVVADLIVFGLIVDAAALVVDGLNLFVMAAYRRDFEDGVSNPALLQNVSTVLSALFITLIAIAVAVI